MFLGQNTVSLDSKWRVAVPQRHREMLADRCDGEMVVTSDLHFKCLLLYPRPVFQEFARNIASLSTEAGARALQRMFIGQAVDCEFDSNGRIVLKEHSREHAELKKQVVLVGVGDKLEIWDVDNWKQQQEKELARARARAEAEAQIELGGNGHQVESEALRNIRY